MMDGYDGQMIFGDLVGLKLPDVRLTDEENPRKTSPRKLFPTGDRTRARCVTSAQVAIVRRRGEGVIAAHAHRTVRGSISVSQTFTVFDSISNSSVAKEAENICQIKV